MRIFVIGAGHVGGTVVEALHEDHELTVVDMDADRLTPLAYRFDVATVQGDGTSRRVLEEAEIGGADLVIACTSRDEVNLVAAMFAKRQAPRAATVIRTSNLEYLDLWREGHLDVDFVVCSELETAHVIARLIGVRAARQTDVFAEGQVQIVEFDVSPKAPASLLGVALRDAKLPDESKVAGIIRGDTMLLPRGDAVIRPGDRLIVIGSPKAAQAWSALLAPGEGRVEDIVVFGAGRVGTAVARVLVEQGMSVRMIEASRERARAVADELPRVRVYNATGVDPDFLERERIGKAQAAIFAMRDDAKNHYAATLAKVVGVPLTIAITHDPVSATVYEAAGIDASVNPRTVTAEELVRFAHDPRTQQVAMFEGARFEVLDIVVRPDSEYVGTPFRDMPIRGALIGAIVRDGTALFPHGDDVIRAGDRAIVFTESTSVPTVEQAL